MMKTSLVEWEDPWEKIGLGGSGLQRGKTADPDHEESSHSARSHKTRDAMLSGD
jgi:hypothetical protein